MKRAAYAAYTYVAFPFLRSMVWPAIGLFFDQAYTLITSVLTKRSLSEEQLLAVFWMAASLMLLWIHQECFEMNQRAIERERWHDNVERSFANRSPTERDRLHGIIERKFASPFDFLTQRATSSSQQQNASAVRVEESL